MIQKAPALTIFFLLLLHIGCTQNKTVQSPPGYDFSKPAIFKMPDVLAEISGIALKEGSADTVYAEQDEEGKVFYFHLGDKEVNHTKFSKKGDFEDIAVGKNYLLLLRSDGVVFSFPLNERFNKDAAGVNEQRDLLDAGEYESMYADQQTGIVYILCKNCAIDKNKGAVSGYTFKLGDDGKLSADKAFSVDENAIAKLIGQQSIRLKASALARNPLTNEWYILSSVNKLLVVTNSDFGPLKVYHLNPPLFSQPEGIAFDKAGNLYISNEAGEGPGATILQFLHAKH